METTQAQLNSIARAVKRLKQGLLTGSPEITSEACRTLFDIGEPAASLLLEELHKIDIGKASVPGGLSLISGLATILHDLDETKSTNFINRSLAGNCDPVVEGRFRSLLKFSRANFRISRFGDIEILEHREIDARFRAGSYVARWLEIVPDRDLAGLQKIYVIAAKSHHDFLGNFLPKLNVITLVWMSDTLPFLPTQWVFRLAHQKTLYHEVGHHALMHREGGQDPEQEEQSEAYAGRMFVRAHPRLRKIASVLRRIIRGRRRLASFDVLLRGMEGETRILVRFEVAAYSFEEAISVARKGLEADGILFEICQNAQWSGRYAEDVSAPAILSEPVRFDFAVRGGIPDELSS